MNSQMLRSFIAVEIPERLQAAILTSLASLQERLPRPLVRWVPAHNLHLTLKFLGDISPASLKQLADALQAETLQHEGFDLSIEGAGAFPDARRARVLWVGIVAPPMLAHLQRCVENTAARMGYPPEERPFSPHLTVGRVGQGVTSADLARVRQALADTRIGNLGSTRVDGLAVFKSDLQPGGSVYTRLYSLPFGGANSMHDSEVKSENA